MTSPTSPTSPTATTIGRRQIHLDFHTAPELHDVAAEFDADAWASGMADAHVDSVTVFAVCHHGMSYYPTGIDTPHPALAGRDLLGEMIGALHARGIRAPVYVTIGWDERLADERPDWLQRRSDGSVPRLEPSERYEPRQFAWRFLCPNNPAYTDHLAVRTEELLRRYDIDGFFFDICLLGPGACFCPHCAQLREERGWSKDTPGNAARLDAEVVGRLADRLTGLVHEHRPEATVFYNSGRVLRTDARSSARRTARETHREIESLPGTHWGYQHFPRNARHAAALGRPWLGMTGRFPRMWGDFGGIKSPDALRYECFRAQAHGGACSVGDQLHPRGRTDPAVRELIAAAYGPVREAEPFYAGSQPLWDCAVVSAGHLDRDPVEGADAEEGAVGMLEELHRNPAVVDDAGPLDSVPLLVLPDHVVVTDALAARLAAFHAAGGHLLLSHRSGFDARGDWALGFLPLTVRAEEEQEGPTYWRCTPGFWPEASASDRVHHRGGSLASGEAGTQVLVERVLPYLQRSSGRHMSHLQAPPLPHADGHPAVLRGPGFTYLADAVFSGYRRHGSGFHREVVSRLLDGVLGAPAVGAGLPGSVQVVPRRRGDDLLVTLLRYLPTRRAHELDTVDEALPLTGLPLQVRGARPETECLTHDGTPLERTGPATFTLPPAEGRLLLRLPGHFTAAAAG